MHHSFIDRYSDRPSPIHAVDPRIKLVAATIMLVCIVTMPVPRAYLLVPYALIIALLWVAATVPPAHLFKRLAVLIPFIALMALGSLFIGDWLSAFTRFGIILAKATLAVATLTLLTATTPFPDLLKAFSKLGMPRIMTSILAFLYRYIFIIIDEAERLSVGRRSRQLAKRRVLAWQSRAWMIGTLLLRSLDRSERIYRAMLSRGFAGEIRTMHAPPSSTPLQIAIAICFILVVAAIRLTPELIGTPEFVS